jgi:hypothetical protein
MGVQLESEKSSVKCGNETILPIEDEPSILKLATRLPERQGYKWIIR